MSLCGFPALSPFKPVYYTLHSDKFLQWINLNQVVIPRKTRKSYLYKVASKLLHQNGHFKNIKPTNHEPRGLVP